MSAAFSCEVCGATKHRWRIDRQGDAVVTWACTHHLTRVVLNMQREWESTRLLITRQHDLETEENR